MANTASRLSANGSLTISGSFDEVTYNPTANVRVNTLSNSQQFNLSPWGTYQATVTANVVVAPDGTTTAFSLNEDTNNGEHLLAQSRTGRDETMTASYYAKAAARTRCYISLSNYVNFSCQVHYDLIAGTITLVTGNNGDYSNISGTITPVGNGWFRCTLTATKGSVNNTNSFTIAPVVGSSSVYLGTGVQAIYIWGAQYEIGTQATPYVQTGTNAITLYSNNASKLLNISSNNSIMFTGGEIDEVTYNPNNIGPTKNLFQNSQDFNQQFAWLIANGTVTKNSALAPDNTQTASLFSASGQYPVIYYYPPGGFSGYKLVEPGKFYTHSMFVKYVNQSRCTLVTESWQIDGSMQFDLLTGSLAGSLNGPITRATITPFPNGWWRISVTYLTPSGSDAVNPNEFYWQPQWRLGNYDGTNYSGSQMLVWGAQLEEGNVATTYVATGFPKNILLFTNELTTPSTYYWQSQNITITKNATISPDGNYNGFLLSSTINGGSNTCFLQRQKFNLPINTNYTYSVYLKQGTSPTTFLNFYNVSPFTELVATITWPAIYGNAPTVSYSGSATRLASTITDAGNGWWRFSLSLNNGSSSGLMWRVYVTTNSTTNVIGNNVYVWGPQLEFGLAPTALIRNTGNYTNNLPLANTNMVMKTVNTGNTFIKNTYDEYSKMSPITEGLIFNIDPGYDASFNSANNTGTMYDTTQNRYRVDLNNSPAYTDDFGGVLKFTSTFGNNAWANTNIPTRTITPTSNYTMSAWVKFNRSNSGLAEFQYYISATGSLVSPQANTGFAYGSAGSILGTTYYGDYGLFWYSQIRSSGEKQLLVGFQNRVTPYAEASPQLAYTMNDSLIFFNWTHIVGVLNNAGNFAGFYVNGVLVNSTTASQIASGSFPYTISTIRICADNVAGGSAIPRNFDGDIGPMSIWNRALSASEIQQMYNSQRSRFGV